MELEILRPASADLIEPLIRLMSGADRSEMYTLSGGRTAEAIETALERSIYSFCGRLASGEPVAMGGITPIGGRPVCWMVAATPLLYHHSKSLLQVSRDEVAEMRRLTREYPLRTYVDRRWRKSVKWLQWLGFEVVGEFELRGRSGLILELN